MGIETIIGGVGLALGAKSARDDNKNAQKANDIAQQQRADSQAYIERMTKQARQDVFKLFPQAQKSRQQGLDSSYDLYKRLVPIQADIFQQGNMGAQDMLAKGLPQIKNAIMGNPVNTDFKPVGLQLPTGRQMPSAPQLQPVSNVPQAPQQNMDYIMAMMGA